MTLDAVFFSPVCLSRKITFIIRFLTVTQNPIGDINLAYTVSVTTLRRRYVNKISAEAASDKLIKNESLSNKFKAKKKLQGVWTIKICFYFYYVIQIQVFWGTSHFLLTLVHRNSSCMTIFLYIKNIPADFTLLDHVSKTRSMIGQNLRS